MHKKKWSPRLCARILHFLLRTHHSQLVASRALRPTLERISTTYKANLMEAKDRIGYNVAGLSFLRAELESRKTAGIFGEVEESSTVEIKAKDSKRKRKALVSH